METGRPTWRSRAWPVAWTALGVLLMVLLAAGAQGPAAQLLPLGVVGLAVLVSVWAVVRTRRERRAHEDRLAAWAGERAAQAERLRIAADLHDLVSHGLGLITVRAAVAARLTGPGGPAEQAAALADIEEVSRETTTELRRMLTVLRSPDAAAALRPAESLADLPGVVAAARGAGLDASLEVTPPPGVSPGVQLTVCAVVREALSNTARHAGPTAVRVRVRRDGGTVVVTIADDGPAGGWQPRPGAGHGLAGLWERVTALGGTLDAGPDGAGFAVTAALPDHPVDHGEGRLQRASEADLLHDQQRGGGGVVGR
ncbi:sensor histidine kinase [Jiangella alkaliphila]|uniref:histidine kinase n=1 Tax=Jiangella alkaliphila TaxID=419479 RepID=A0A1H2L5W6_9ACTN|nr:histidine kinase [Jiangella alkaliphila]SDU76192.1 Signal transduction histidine kinase [Jiangella alkaliphila]